MNQVREISDMDVAFLALLAGTLRADYVGEREISLWKGSPFYWIKSRPSRQIGAIGEALVSGWAASKGFDVQKPTSSEHDRRIAGLKVEIKFSTLWTTGEVFKFQQLRDQDYDFAFLLGISPFDAGAWFVPKGELSYDRPPALRPQHGGAAGHDTKWLSFPAVNPPDWLSEYGGRLSDVRRILEHVGS